MPPELTPARATARANIALAKYWGKSDTVYNLPAVPSISLTLDARPVEWRVSRCNTAHHAYVAERG